MEIKLPKIKSNRNKLFKINEKKQEKEEAYRSIRNKFLDKLPIRL
jgi:hypothetical protein